MGGAIFVNKDYRGAISSHAGTYFLSQLQEDATRVHIFANNLQGALQVHMGEGSYLSKREGATSIVHKAFLLIKLFHTMRQT